MYTFLEFGNDFAGIAANTALLAAQSSSNDYGVGVLNTVANNLLQQYNYTDRSGNQFVNFGDTVRVDDNGYLVEDPIVDEINSGDKVQIVADGAVVAVYEYAGASPLTGGCCWALRSNRPE